MKPKPLPTAEKLRTLLSYDEATGIMTWRARPREEFMTQRGFAVWNARYANQPALASVANNGYKRGAIYDVGYLQHRIIWKMLHDVEPIEIDHINGVRSDNRIANLRSVDRVTNTQNMCARTDGSSGTPGVYRHQKANGFYAMAWSAGTRKYLGSFKTISAAIEARKASMIEIGFHANHGRAPQ